MSHVPYCPRGLSTAINCILYLEPLLDSIASETVAVAMESNKGLRQIIIVYCM